MADLLAQFDIVERAEQARDGRGGAGGLGGGGDRARAPINPFDDIQELRPVAAMQVIHRRTYSVIDSRLLVLQSHTKSKWLQISLPPPLSLGSDVHKANRGAFYIPQERAVLPGWARHHPPHHLQRHCQHGHCRQRPAPLPSVQSESDRA